MGSLGILWIDASWRPQLVMYMQTRCTSIAKTGDGVVWTIINGGCLELVGTRLVDNPEFCPILSYVVQPEVILPR